MFAWVLDCACYVSWSRFLCSFCGMGSLDMDIASCFWNWFMGIQVSVSDLLIDFWHWFKGIQVSVFDLLIDFGIFTRGL